MDVPNPTTEPAASATASGAQVNAPPSTHRLPTINASDALGDLDSTDSVSGSICTGVNGLDILTGGGFEVGKVTEIWGPSGSGKTAVALQAAISTLKKGDKATWVDSSTTINSRRLQTLLTSAQLTLLTHTTPPTLTHLLYLLLHPPQTFLPSQTTLLILDDLNTLLDLDYPRNTTFSTNKTESQKWRQNRRYGILGSLIQTLNKLAATHHLAIIVTTGCATRMRSAQNLPAVLVPGLGGSEWDAGVWTRVATFRDFGGRFVGAQKLRGVNVGGGDGGLGNVAAFGVGDDGSLVEVEGQGGVDSSPTRKVVVVSTTPAKGRKRTFGEIADSDGEEPDEYGWVETDEEEIAGGDAPTLEDNGATKEAAIVLE